MENINLSLWQPYLIAVAIGLLIGVEREKAHPYAKTMGVRTFFLVSLLGALAGSEIDKWLAVVLSVFALSLVVVSYFLQSANAAKKSDRGLTTEFAAGIVFCLSYIAHAQPALSAVFGPVVAAILFYKPGLHRFSRDLKPVELQAALLLLLTGVFVTNLFPNEVIDPWGFINPQKFGFLVLLLAILEFASYVLTKLMGRTRGQLLVGFLGGLVSSTAVLVSSARQSVKDSDSNRQLFCTSLVAKLAALVELLFLVALLSMDLFKELILPIGICLVLGSLILWFMIRHQKKHSQEIDLKSPLDLLGVLRLSLLLAAILAAVSLAKRFFGTDATYLVSFLTGLFELHGVSLANATLLVQKQLILSEAAFNVLLAVMASFFAKVTIAWSIGHRGFAKKLSWAFGMMSVVCLVAMMLEK